MGIANFPSLGMPLNLVEPEYFYYVSSFYLLLEVLWVELTGDGVQPKMSTLLRAL